jgi:phage shock protein C
MRKDKREGFGSRRRRGWGMGLYRNRSQGWIGGVCSGLADHWDLPYWMTRLAAVALLIFTGSLAFWAYVAAWVMLAPRPTRWDAEQPVGRNSEEVEMEYDENLRQYRPRTVFRYSDAPTERVRKAKERLDGALRRVEAMERYVTSRQYDLNREFSKL